MNSSHSESYWTALRCSWSYSTEKKVYFVSCFCLTSRWLKYLHSAVWELQFFSVASGFYCAGASNTTHDHHHDVHTAQRPLHVTSSSGAVSTSMPSIVQSLRTFKCLPSCFSFATGVRTHYCFISSHEKAPNRFHTGLQFFQQLYAKKHYSRKKKVK